MIFKKILKPKLSKVILSIILCVVFTPMIKYQNQCLTADGCGFTLRSLFTHVTKNIPMHGVNYTVLIIGLIISYLILSISFTLIFKNYKNKTT